MSPLTITVTAFAVALVVMSGAFMGGAVVVAVPVAFIAIAITGLLDLRRRRRAAHSIQSEQPHDVDFTERDRQTLVSE